MFFFLSSAVGYLFSLNESQSIKSFSALAAQ